jgi:hypothetical protein
MKKNIFINFSLVLRPKSPATVLRRHYVKIVKGENGINTVQFSPGLAYSLINYNLPDYGKPSLLEQVWGKMNPKTLQYVRHWEKFP